MQDNIHINIIDHVKNCPICQKEIHKFFMQSYLGAITPPKKIKKIGRPRKNATAN